MSYYATFLKKIPKIKHFLDNDCSDMIYHYTKPEKLLKIVSNKTLRLSNVLYLNDKAEVSYTYRLIADLINEDKTLNDELFNQVIEHFSNKYKHIVDGFNDLYQQEYYTISFSTERDNLILWNNYSKEKTYTGYNLGFDINDIMCDIYKKQYNAICGCIIYNENKQKSIIKAILNHWNKKYERTLRATKYKQQVKENRLNDILYEVIDILSLVSVFFKNSNFKDEKEYRIVIVNQSRQGSLVIPTNFVEKNGMFVPYIEYRFPKRALKSINIGPTMNESIFYTSTNRMLFNFGYEKIDVNWSKIPLRY
ncbi:MAG: DUF2971 domain-containing protein [Candidatus Gastranaerophilaceae bacterium]